MNESLSKTYDIKIAAAKNNFLKHGFAFSSLDNCSQLIQLIQSLLPEHALVGDGGSQTLIESGLIDCLRKMNIQFLDTHRSGLNAQQKTELYHQAFQADYFFTSANALDIGGNIYNIDGNGNRIGALCYGPKQVFVICGINKLCENEQAAINHARNVAAVSNAVRLNKDTPCRKTGYCLDCQSSERICSQFLKTTTSVPQGRIHIIIIKEELGF